MYKNLSAKILNFFVLFIIFIILFSNMKYSIIGNDDMLDYLLNKNIIYHCRLITYLLQVFFISLLPNWLSIHVQDFAIVSQAFLKSIIIVFLLNTMSISFSQFQKKDFTLPFINIFLFFLFFSFISKLKFFFGIDTSAFFYGYIFPIPFFLLFWYKIVEIYVKEKAPTKKDLLTICFLIIILLTSNEEYQFVSFLMILFLFLGKKIHKKTILIILISIFLSFLIIFPFHNGFYEILKGYNISLCFDFSYYEISKFFYVFYNKLFYTVLFLWIPIFIGCICLYCDKNNKQTNLKILKLISVTIIGFLSFFCLLYFLGDTFSYENYDEYYLFPRYWILHPGILLCFYCFLINVNLFILGYMFFKKIYKHFTVTTSIFIVGCFIFLIRYSTPISISDISNRQTLYIMEKLSVFYLQQGKTAILPAENADSILPAYNNHMPKELEDKSGKAYENKIYKNYTFLKYIYYVYKLDISPGMMFIPGNREKALDIFKANGGTLTNEELETLKFSNIQKETYK